MDRSSTTLLLVLLFCIAHKLVATRASSRTLLQPTGSGTACSKDAASSTFIATTTTNSAGAIVRRIQAAGCPGYDYSGQTTPNPTYVKNYDIQVAYNPVISTGPVVQLGVYLYKNQTGTPPNGAMLAGVGIALNGVTIFGNADIQQRDAYVYEGASFDSCRGHSAQAGDYHYHTEPADKCVATNEAGKHSPLLGIMYDGIPIFGGNGDNGSPPTDLDECNGHVDTTHPYYHYHFQSPWNQYPYMPNCLKGCVNGTNMPRFDSHSCTPASTQYDYSAFHTFFATYSNRTGTFSPSPNSSAQLLVQPLLLLASMVAMTLLLL